MTAQAETIRWETSLKEAQGRAVQKGKPILLDFSAAPINRTRAWPRSTASTGHPPR